jgi:hypothetical protein
MKILVAIPKYDGMIPAQTTVCLLKEQVIALKNGDELNFIISYGSAGIAQARNQLATEFLDSDYDRLFFLDHDITWEGGDLLKVAKMPVDFVGGAYRFKKVGEWYPVSWLRDEKGLKGIQLSEDTALLEVEGLPTGFLAISRKVFKKMLDKFPERSRESLKEKHHGFFQMPIIDGHLYGEDLYFSRIWIEMGEKIYLYPELNLIHWDFRPTPHHGHIGNWLKNRDKPQLDLEKEIEKLTANMEKTKHMKGLDNAQPGNP